MLTRAQRDALQMLEDAMDACPVEYLPNWITVALERRLRGPVLEATGQKISHKGHMKTRQENGAAPMPEAWGSQEIAMHVLNQPVEGECGPV